MKIKIILCLLWFSVQAWQGRLQAQSPYLSFEASMDADILNGEKYRMIANFCTPVQSSEVKTVYGTDTSSISFKSLEKHMIQCSPVLNTGDSADSFNMFKYANQNFGYEKIVVLRVIRLNQQMESSMQIIVPLRYQSFLTFIKIRDIVFMPGKTIWIDLPDTREGGSLKVNISMKEYAFTEQKFPG